MPCKRNGGKKREPRQNILIAQIWKDVNGGFLLWHLTFLTQMFKKYSEASLPPLWFFIPYEVLMVLLSRREKESMLGSEETTTRVFSGHRRWSSGQGQAWAHVPLVSEQFLFAPRTPCLHSADRTMSHILTSSVPERCAWVGGWVGVSRVRWAHFSDPHQPLSAYSLALVAVGWALTLPCSANPALSCSGQHKSAALLKGPGSCYRADGWLGRADGWLGSTVGDKHCMNNIVLNSKTQSPRG